MSANYKALTRTYRPQTFDDIVSQEHVSNTLKNAISTNRLSHAYLFCGPRGVGKTTMARVLARTVNNVAMDVDGEHLNNTLNIVEIDAASNNSVEDIRSLRERVRIPPQNGRFKIYIIDEIHMLSKQAFNALLKTLEEPPEHVIFIFATTEPHRILPTILSRCQRFDFRRITVDEMVNRLEEITKKEKIRIDRKSLHVIAKKADGALRDALGILDQTVAFCGTAITSGELHKALNIVSYERMFELTDTLIKKDISAGMALLHNLLHTGTDIQEFLGALTEHFRNLYLAKDLQNSYLIETDAETKKRFQKTADIFSDDDLMRMMHIVHEAEFSIRNAQQPRIHLEITLLKLFHMTRTDGLEELLIKLDALQKKINTQNKQLSIPDEPSTPATGEKTHHSSTLTDKTEPPAQKHDPAEQSDILGIPTLKRPKNHLSALAIRDISPKIPSAENTNEVRGNLALSPRPKPSGKQAHSSDGTNFTNTSGNPEKIISIDVINKIWPDYLNKLQLHAGSMLYFSIQRTRPVAFKDNVVTLECNDRFTSDLIDEQQHKLCDIVKEHFGYMFRFSTRVVKSQKQTEIVHDPYEQFSKLQKKDPVLRKLVKLFGAEPEY